MDEFIIKTFTTAEEEKKKGAIALIALGGYGRRELYPFSDVDLLLLHDRKAGKYMQKVAESILSLPMFPHLTEEQVDYVCRTLTAALG